MATNLHRAKRKQKKRDGGCQAERRGLNPSAIRGPHARRTRFQNRHVPVVVSFSADSLAGACSPSPSKHQVELQMDRRMLTPFDFYSDPCFLLSWSRCWSICATTPGIMCKTTSYPSREPRRWSLRAEKRHIGSAIPASPRNQEQVCSTHMATLEIAGFGVRLSEQPDSIVDTIDGRSALTSHYLCARARDSPPGVDSEAQESTCGFPVCQVRTTRTAEAVCHNVSSPAHVE